jgi:hypothetical protein
MRQMKPLALAALCSVLAGPVLADAAMVDVKQNMYDADYETIIAEYGYTVGVAVYGVNDADYDAMLTDVALFPPLLGRYDADYEAVLMPASAFTDTEIAFR